jgi:hypothetical protein
LERLLRIHEDQLVLLREQLENAVEGETRQEFDPNPKVRSREWAVSQREGLEREIEIHKQLIKLGRDPKVLEALGELAENRDYAGEAAHDPHGTARKRGIELPANMILSLFLEPDRVQLQINYYEDLYPFMVTWNSDSGFSPPRGHDPSAKEDSTVSSV